MTTETNLRVESDALGSVKVPAEALYGAQTARAMENFPVSGLRLPRRMIRALGLIKRAAARVNKERGLLPAAVADAIVAAATEVVEGRHDQFFPVDVFQTGSGTSSHMNANEVIANRAIQLLGGRLGSKAPVHPNDHVNRGQSSNDVFPSAAHIAALEALEEELLPALRALGEALAEKARAFDSVVKTGRTHLMDAAPIRLGQELSGHAAMVAGAVRRIETARAALYELALGGTAVGTGLGAAPGFAAAVIALLRDETSLPLRQAANPFEALAARDGLVEVSAALRGMAVSLTKVANDLRWLGSGPRCGLGELRLPELQPGSSIMPGKVNPVMPEMLLMVCAQIVGHDATVAWAGASGILELNTMMPLIAFDVLQSIAIGARAVHLFRERCVVGLSADEERCRALCEQSLGLATALVPHVGYDQAAALAREALATGRTLREICLQRGVVAPDELDEVLDARAMTGP